MLSQLVNIQYCYDYLISQIPVGLLLYSHIPTAIVALLFGSFLLVNSRNIRNVTLFIVSFFFALWCLVDIASWFSFLGSDITMFAWSLADLFSLIFFFFSYYFLYVFATRRDLPMWQKVVGVGLLIPTIVWTFLGSNLLAFDLNVCEAWENSSVTGYLFYIEGAFLLAAIVVSVIEYRKTKDKAHKREIALAGTGVTLFLGIFLAATLLASILINYESTAAYAYNFEIYGLFGMPILLIYLGYLIVRYQSFDLKVFGAQALVVALIAVIASEFAFVQTLTTRILVAVTLILTTIIGLVLVRSVKREIEQRDQIQLLATDLQKANKQQIVLIGFITHQIKGFVTKSRNIFAMVKDGDYGPVPDSMKSVLEEGLRSDTQGIATIQEILNASNIRSGKLTYTMAPFDLKALIDEIAASLKSNADTKGIALNLDTGAEQLMYTGDRAQLVNAFKNLIDNSIKYTIEGHVNVSLTKRGNTVHFEISDTGVGITSDDMKNLFTEGGHGKESTKVNVESTGFGLYIVKNIIEAHKGKVWAESDGAGKGSRFIIELPA